MHDTLVERVINPDTWQTAGFDQPRMHPITSLTSTGKVLVRTHSRDCFPHDYDAAVQKFGVVRVRQMGLIAVENG